MIPILYNGTEQAFLHNGLGRLADAITCKVTEERNGQYELVMTYPITGVHYSDIAENRIIMAKTEDGGQNQAFIIYKVSKPLNGIITVNAEHISYLLNGFIVMPFTAASCVDAMSKIAPNTVISTPFAYHTDVTTTGSFSFDTPRAIRGLLGGEQGSFLDVYGGYDYKFDNFDVYLLQNRGTDNGVSIRYGKNLVDLKDTIDTTSVYTGIVPYWADNEGNKVYLPERVVLSDHASDYPYKILKSVDFSSDFETQPTEAQLRAKAQSYVESNAGWKIKNSIDVSFVNLGQTEEYKQFKALERVKLCDYVTVIYDKLGVDVKTKVIKTVYDVLAERYDTISLGDTTYSLAKAIQGAIDAPSSTEVNSSLKNAIQRATKLIQGGLGGHVVFNTNGDGEPQEILIMDTDDISTAVNVIRMNLNGIGFSHNGYEGPFNTAWTIDGHFVADYIDTGELNGAIIKAGSLQVNAFSENAKTDLNLIHSYLPYDLFSNIDRWEINAHAVTLGTYTIGEETYDCMFMDGTGILVYTPSYQTQVKSDYMGKPTLDIKFDYIFKSNVTVTQQQFFYLYYKKTDGTYFTSYWNIAAGYYAKDTIYTFTATKIFAEDVAPDYIPRIGFRFIPNVETCITNFTVTGLMGDYERSTLEFTVNGLSSVVQKGSIISSINQSAESVSIEADKINLTGNLDLRGDFTAYETGDENTYAELKYGRMQLFHNDGSDQPIKTIEIGTKGNTPSTNAGYLELSRNGTVLTKVYTTYIETPTVYTDGISVNNEATFYSGCVTKFFGTAQFYDDVYNASGSTVFVSDKRKKKDIKDLAIDKAKSFLMALNPRIFKFKEGTSDRFHHGFIAQEVKEAMQGDDWGVYVENKDTDFIGLRYDELIADLVAVVQDQEKRIDALERKMEK